MSGITYFSVKKILIENLILAGFYNSPNLGNLFEEYPVAAAGTFRLSVPFDIYKCATFNAFIQL